MLTLVAVVAPLGWFAAGLADRQQASQQLAAEVAALLQREVAAQPRLWRYDTPKLADHIEHLRAEHHGLVVLIFDTTALALTVPAPTPTLVDAPWAAWSQVPVATPARGQVQAAVDLRPLWRSTAVLGLCFGVLAATLAALVWWLPLRAVRRAEAQIAELLTALRQTSADLTELARTLEIRVAERSQQLESALADVRQHEQHLRDVAGQALRLQESERRSIARDLHDGIGQALTAVRLQVQVLALHSGLPEQAHGSVRAVLRQLDDTLDETRRAVRRLAPPLLAEQGLAVALQQTCATWAGNAGLVIDWHGTTLPPLDTATEVAAFRIVQEALTNAVRHSGAQKVTVELAVQGEGEDPRWLVLSVTDDGNGMAATAENLGQGLPGMRDRAELLGGSLTVDAADGGGCRICARLPCPAR